MNTTVWRNVRGWRRKLVRCGRGDDEREKILTRELGARALTLTPTAWAGCDLNIPINGKCGTTCWVRSLCTIVLVTVNRKPLRMHLGVLFGEGSTHAIEDLAPRSKHNVPRMDFG
jgi:hypothetical protein